jgi:hypothetical protein
MAVLILLSFLSSSHINSLSSLSPTPFLPISLPLPPLFSLFPSTSLSLSFLSSPYFFSPLSSLSPLFVGFYWGQKKIS